MQKHEYSSLTEYFFKVVSEKDFEGLKDLVNRHPNYDINSTDNEGNNLLHTALNDLNYHSYPILQYLLSLGADPMAVNENYKNAIDVAKSYGLKGDIALSILNMYKTQKMRELSDIVNGKRSS